MYHDISNVGYPHTFSPQKIYCKKYWEEINIDIINIINEFDESADHK